MLMTGADIAVKTLIDMGVETVFGYPGRTVVDLYDSLYRYSDKLTHVLTAHEQGACHAADGYARASGRPGVVIATSGPGATNLVTGIATAMLDSVPLVAVTGNVSRGLIGRDAFQEVDITGVTMPVTKHSFFVTKGSKLQDALIEAFRIALSGRPGPVLVDIPSDVQSDECEYVEGKGFTLDKTVPDYSDVKKAAKLLNSAKRPCIYVGGGALKSGAGDLVKRTADRIDAVICSSLMGIGTVESTCERYLGMQGMHGRYASTMALDSADVVLALGVRFSDRAVGRRESFRENKKIIHVDIDNSELDKNIEADVCILSDVLPALEGIFEHLSEKRHPSWQSQVKAFKETEISHEARHGGFSPKRIIETINSVKRGDTPLVTDVGQHQMWAAKYADISQPRTFLSSGGLGTMGFGMGAAIGAGFATGKRSVLITGDGSFGMNLNELATAVKYRVPLTIVLINNGVLGMVHQWQKLLFDARYSATVVDRKTDFVLLAEAFGAKGVRAGDTAELEDALRRSFESEDVWLIECSVSADEEVYPMIPPGGAAADIIFPEA